MQSKILKKYSDNNPEKFNKSFILGKTDDDILEEITIIFKSLEILDEVKIVDVSLNRNEEELGPIKQQGHYYKSPLESRLLKIHYKVKIEGKESLIEKDMFLPKLLNNGFYMNEGVRFFPIYQIVDNVSYSTNNGVSLKSLMLPITVILQDNTNISPEFGKDIVEKIPNYIALIFSKKISPLLYFMTGYALSSLETAGINPFENLDKFQEYTDDNMLTKFKEFFDVDIKFARTNLELVEADRTVFTLSDKNKVGLSFSLPDNVVNTEKGKIIIGMIMNIRAKEKKNKTVLTYDEFICPWNWIDVMIDVSGFSKSPDPFKRYEKVKAVFSSLSRIIDEKSRKTLTIPKKDKEDFFTILRYLIINFTTLFNLDSQDLNNKRVRLYEYILFPLRVYFSQHINRIVNLQSNRDAGAVEKIFTSLTPMYLLKSLITSQLLRTYNATNDFNLFSTYLKGTFKGPQALGKSITMEHRDLHPSYVGKIGLVAASPGDPGTSFTFSPFVKTYNDYFDVNAADKATD